MVIKNLLGRVNIEILRAGDAVWQTGEDFEVGSGDSAFGVAAFETHVLGDFVFNDFEDVVRDDFAFEVFSEFFDLDYSFVLFVCEVLFEAFVDFFEFLLGFDLVFSIFVFVFEGTP